jgi:Protein of unknown function (DUF2867)
MARCLARDAWGDARRAIRPRADVPSIRSTTERIAGMDDLGAAVRSVSVPSGSRVARAYATTDLADAYAICLPAGASIEPEQLARFVLSQQSPATRALMQVRDALVAGFGLKTARQLAVAPAGGARPRVGIFKVYETLADEIVLGEDDAHLDFRVSVLCRPSTSAAQAPTELILSTVVHCHNRLGRLYILLIAPFHRAIVQSMLRRAARAGWPRQAPSGAGAAP